MGALALNGTVLSKADRPGHGALPCVDDISELKWEGSGDIVAFCCSNSAYEAARGAEAMGINVPRGLRLVRLPCAGNVAPIQLLKAFQYGAAGVMVLACHHDSCKSVDGSRIGKWRATAVRQMIDELDIHPGRLFFGTLAPATPMDFVKMTRAFTESLERLNKQDAGEPKRVS
jgi:coenzyme F420-reducing hydrogenase delta subunit